MPRSKKIGNRFKVCRLNEDRPSASPPGRTDSTIVRVPEAREKRRSLYKKKKREGIEKEEEKKREGENEIFFFFLFERTIAM